MAVVREDADQDIATPSVMTTKYAAHAQMVDIAPTTGDFQRSDARKIR